MEISPLLIPILALAIPVTAIVFNGLQRMWKLRIEEARIRAGSPDAASTNEVGELRAELEQMRRELDEVQERLDFTERLLAQTRERQQLPGGRREP